MMDFLNIFQKITGNPPFPWQERLFVRFVAGIGARTSLDIPTGLGKTSTMAVWLIARSLGACLPRRLIYIVDRRVVVDQATHEAEKLRSWVDDNPDFKSKIGLAKNQSVPISTLRGQYVDNREWLEDPSALAIIVGTVDMIGSRLLFEGYGVSRGMRPYHAGLLGSDTLFVLDEAHLVPPFERLLQAIVANAAGCDALGDLNQLVPRAKLVSLSATGRKAEGDVLQLTDADLEHSVARKRLEATKGLSFRESDGAQPIAELLAEEAWQISKQGKSNVRVIVFSNARVVAEDACKELQKLAKGDSKRGIESVAVEIELFVGARRVRERSYAAEWLSKHGFLAGSEIKCDKPTFVFATSAGEVGVDLDADHMVCDLVAWERMVQRLGRVNRRGNGDARIRVVIELPQPDKKTQDAANKLVSDRTKAEQKKVEEFEADKGRVEALKRPILSLPIQNGFHDASPGAIRILKIKAENDERLAGILAAATSTIPLRPALTRAVVDAWSMTSLEKHTGRPIVAPWLRGWVDDIPQTTVVWRRFLPVCRGTQASEKKRKADAKQFFEHASPHMSETLETESFRVLDWLIKRARAIKKSIGDNRQPESDDASSNVGALRLETVVGIILGNALDVVDIFTVADLGFDSHDKNNIRRKDELERNLSNATIVLDQRFGGLNEQGLLDGDVMFTRRTADDHSPAPWIAIEETKNAGQTYAPIPVFRIRESEDGVKSNDSNWRTCFQFVSSESTEGEPKGYLMVEKWRHTQASEDGRSVARMLQELEIHQKSAEREAERLAFRLELPDEYSKMLRLVARLHDEGKRAERWQRAFGAPLNGIAYAKTPGPVRFTLLDGYRHEFGSLLIAERDPEVKELNRELQELALHLVAAHHGFSRPTIRTNGCNDSPPSALEGRARDVALRFAKLQQIWGPWGLAWWESLLRAADQRASREIETEQQEDNNG